MSDLLQCWHTHCCLFCTKYRTLNHLMFMLP